MAFPSSSASALKDIFDSLRARATTIKVTSTAIRAKSLTGTCTYADIMAYMAGLKVAKAGMNGYPSTTGLNAYAQAQLNDGVLNLATEYASMTSALDSTITWIAGNLPKDGSNYALAVQIAADGTTTDRTFTSGQLAGFRTQVDALLATIN